MTNGDREKALAKLDRLDEMARNLRQSRYGFEITRLTVLKRFCHDPKATVRFGLYLVERVKVKARKRFRPLIDEAIVHARRFLARSLRPAPQAAWDALWALEASQNEIQHQRWVDVRIIHSQEALLAEHMLRCVVRPWESSHWGYRMAALYTERYDPSYGTGLIPSSASALQEVIAFWTHHYRAGRRKGRAASTGRNRTRSPRAGRLR